MVAKKFLQNNRAYLFISGLSRKEVTAALVVLATILVGMSLPGRLTVSISDSLNKRVFFLTGYGGIKHGDYMVFKGEAEHIAFAKLDHAVDKIIKIVGCAPGETLTRNLKGEFYCNGVFLGQALQADSKGRPLPQFGFSGIVPADNYFMIGDNPRSFDSKYFGFIHADRMLYKALPIF